MDRNFQRALPLVLKHEGGFVNHPQDPGGATNKGVTIATFRAYVKPNATVDDLKRITDEQVAAVYYRHYWSVVQAPSLPAGLDYAVFDFAVNSGPARAVKMLQAIVGVTQDGKVGPQTLAAVRARSTSALINGLCDARMAFLKRLKTWQTFGKGWTNRVTAVRRDALAMVGNPADVEMIEIPIEKPIVPQKVETKVKEKSNLLTVATGLLGSGSIGLGWLGGMDWQAILAGGVVLTIFVMILLLLRSQIVSAVRAIKAEVAG